jgi:hypothetical protein
MKIAYIVSAYRNPDQVVRLIRRLDGTGVDFFVHVDKKASDAEYGRIVQDLDALDNVHFLERHRCYWGGFGHVRATLKGIEAATRSGRDFDYVVLLTGQDYPIASNDQIAEFLRSSGGSSFMAHFPLPTDEWEGGGLQRIDRWHVRLGARRYVVPPRPRVGLERRFPAGLQPYGGSAYWCLSRPSVDYLERFVRENPSFVRFFRYVEVPDEIFFQTILMNSPLRDTVVNDDLRYVEWRNWNDARPASLGKEDFARIMASGKLFARKFDIEQDRDVLDLIDDALGVPALGS